jgi:hypothetical protein
MKKTIRFHREDDLGIDGAERMPRVAAGRDIECPLRGADAVPQHDNGKGEPKARIMLAPLG